MPRRASQGVDRYWCEYIQVPVLVPRLPSTNTEYRRRRRQKQTATTRPGTSRQEAGRRSRTEVVRFPFAARLNELHRLRGCGWVWWRERGLGKGARGAWKDFCPNHTPCPGRRYLCLAGERRDGGGVGCRSGPGEHSNEYLVPALLFRSWGQELTAMRTLYKDKDEFTWSTANTCADVWSRGPGSLSVCHLDVLVRFRAICWQRLTTSRQW